MAVPVRFGLKLSQQVHPIDAKRDAWKIADQAGFDHIWPFDHLIALGGDPTQPSAADRIRMLDESIRAIKLLWSEPRTTFKGRFYQFEDAIAEPKPLQKPHPPIWIGGSGPKRTLRVVAKHADVWNGGGNGPDETKELLKILGEHCAKVGRDPKTIRLSRNFRVDDADAALKQLEWSRALGYTDFLLFPGQGDLRKGAEIAAKLLPRLRAAA